MDRIVAFSSQSWTSHLPLICCVHDFLNLLHIPKILYLLFITFQAFPRIYGSLLCVHLVLVGYPTARLSICFHDPLDLVIIHHDWIQGFLLLSCIHFSFFYQCVPPSPMHAGKFSCLTPLSLHIFYRELSRKMYTTIYTFLKARIEILSLLHCTTSWYLLKIIL
jgi:hypothetical protein